MDLLEEAKEYYSPDYQEQYYIDITKYDGMYYPPLWVCQSVEDCKAYCLNHLPNWLAQRIIRQQRGRFGTFLSTIELCPDQNLDPKIVNTEWWSDINLLPFSNSLQCCSVCGEGGTRIYFDKKNNFRERFNQLRQDVCEWIERNCDEKERQCFLDYMEENWDEYQLFHGLPF